MMKWVHETMYYGSDIVQEVSSDTRCKFESMLETRCHELYEDKYDELNTHGPRDDRVAELLLDDAVRTGKWKELPTELQARYHERVGD